MPDGDSLLLGTTNTSAAETSLERSGDDIHTALAVNNTNGNGIVGWGPWGARLCRPGGGGGRPE
jgi:hypothetical protein